jgi:hypothetical protein
MDDHLQRSRFPIANLVQTPLFSRMGKSRLVRQGSTVKTTVQEINDPVSLTVFSQEHPYPLLVFFSGHLVLQFTYFPFYA